MQRQTLRQHLEGSPALISNVDDFILVSEVIPPASVVPTLESGHTQPPADGVLTAGAKIQPKQKCNEFSEEYREQKLNAAEDLNVGHMETVEEENNGRSTQDCLYSSQTRVIQGSSVKSTSSFEMINPGDVELSDHSDDFCVLQEEPDPAQSSSVPMKRREKEELIKNCKKVLDEQKQVNTERQKKMCQEYNQQKSQLVHKWKQEVQRRQLAEEENVKLHKLLAERDSEIEDLKERCTILVEQVKEHETAFKHENRDRVVEHEKRRRFERYCKTYEGERDYAVQLAKQSENEIHQLRAEVIRLQERNSAPWTRSQPFPSPYPSVNESGAANNFTIPSARNFFSSAEHEPVHYPQILPPRFSPIAMIIDKSDEDEAMSNPRDQRHAASSHTRNLPSRGSRQWQCQACSHTNSRTERACFNCGTIDPIQSHRM